VILFRCFPWDREAGDRARGGPLWFPRMLQGDGRHDNPSLYGCLYVSSEPISPVVERLARFRGRSLTADKLRSFGRAVALAGLVLAEEAKLIDLDEPAALEAEELRPSIVATGERARSQAYAAALYERHPEAAGLRWWSTFESQWPNVTLFDRAADEVEVEDVQALVLADDVVADAAHFLGLPIVA
jgi:hypothetical protein